MFIGVHIGLTYAFGYLMGKYFNLGSKETYRLAILASIFGILPDLDYFIQVITGLNVHRYVAHSVIIGLGICLLVVWWRKLTAILAFGTLSFLIILGIALGNKSLYFVSLSFAFLLIFAIASYAFIKPGLNKKIIFADTFIPYVSHILFDLMLGGSAVFFPILYILTGQIYWVKLDVFPETGPLPVSFWILELMGVMAAIIVMIKYQDMSYRKYGYTALAGGAALLFFYLVGHNYIFLDELVIGMIAIYLGNVVQGNGNVRFMIMNCWAGYCMLTIISILY